MSDTNATEEQPTPAPVSEVKSAPELSVLFPLLTVYTIVYMGLMVYDFLARSAFDMPGGFMPAYIALVAAYAADKEIRRWVTGPQPARRGSVFVYLWMLFLLAAFVVYSLARSFVLPPELMQTALQVLGIFFGSKVSKYVFDRRLASGGGAGGESERQERVLALIREKGRVTRREVQNLLGLNERTARRLLGQMVEQGLIRQDRSTPGGQDTAYVMVSETEKAPRSDPGHTPDNPGHV